MSDPTLQDRCFDTVLERVRYMAQVAKTQVMKMTLNLAAERIAELEAALRAIAEYHSWCRGRPIGLAYQPEFHTERRDFALKALEGGAGK